MSSACIWAVGELLRLSRRKTSRFIRGLDSKVLRAEMTFLRQLRIQTSAAVTIHLAEVVVIAEMDRCWRRSLVNQSG